LIFLGRSDAQVKIRGVRIELGEIEAVLRQHPEVDSTAVAAPGSGTVRNLVAWLVLKPSAISGSEGFRVWLRERLPEFMVPARIVPVTALPLLPNGKLDYAGLSSLLPPDATPDFVEPATDLERSIAAVWKEVLHLDRVGVTHSFFDIGGHSLLSIEMQQKLRASLGTDITLADVFRFPTIESLAAHLATRTRAKNALAAPAECHLIQHIEPESAAVHRNGLPNA
jgi:acyl carrier protein